MGEAVLLQAVRIGIFANGKPLKATVFHSGTWIEPHRSDFLRRYPAIQDVCTLEFVACESGDPGLIQRLADLSRTSDVVTFALCEPHDTHNLSIGLKLLELTPKTGARFWSGCGAVAACRRGSSTRRGGTASPRGSTRSA